eukprot:6083532-Lingulodinium_polyedra.AAC.1
MAWATEPKGSMAWKPWGIRGRDTILPGPNRPKEGACMLGLWIGCGLESMHHTRCARRDAMLWT